MNISFHGVKNVGSYYYSRPSAEQVRLGNYVLILKKGRHTNIHVELNNKNGNDLDEFKDILKKYPNDHNSCALNFAFDYFQDENTGARQKFYIVNNHQIQMNDENLPVLSKIFKLMKKISKMDKEELKVENSYVNSPEARAEFEVYKTYYPEKDFERILDIAHTRYFAQSGAEYLEKKLDKELSNFIMNS